MATPATRLTATGAKWDGIPGPEIPGETFAAQLAWTMALNRPSRLIVVEPGEWKVREEIAATAEAAGVPLEIRPDRHFLCAAAEFAAHAKARKQLRMEFFYREMRQKTGVLMDGAEPAGGQWNYDRDNRESFGRDGPGLLPAPRRFPPDATTREVLTMVAARFAKHPGELEKFAWPVTASEAREALDDFIAHRLPDFGSWEDAMWSGGPWLCHSRLSAVLNLKLLDPRHVLAAAERAWPEARAPLASVEGFVRQILGWREFVRGIYGHFMPGYLDRNALGADQPLPLFYWTGETDMNCLRHTLRQTLGHGYAHHIQRLMVTGLFSLLLGVRPREIHGWYLAVYVDADCTGCRFDPAERTGPRACPFTTLYWDFLLRHEVALAKNPRIVMQVRNLNRLGEKQKAAIREQAGQVREGCQTN